MARSLQTAAISFNTGGVTEIELLRNEQLVSMLRLSAIQHALVIRSQAVTLCARVPG